MSNTCIRRTSNASRKSTLHNARLDSELRTVPQRCDNGVQFTCAQVRAPFDKSVLLTKHLVYSDIVLGRRRRRRLRSVERVPRVFTYVRACKFG